MNPLLQQFLLTLFRAGLQWISGGLVLAGIFKGEEMEKYVGALAVALVALVWSLWSKYKSRLTFLTALQAPPGTTEAEVKEIVKDKTKPPVALFLIAGLVVMMGSGCASTPGKLIASSSSTVDHAMQLWAVYVVDGHATADQEARVREAQAQYERAEDAAVSALVEFQTTGDKTAWQSAVDYLREQQQNLLALVSGFTGKALP